MNKDRKHTERDIETVLAMNTIFQNLEHRMSKLIHGS